MYTFIIDIPSNTSNTFLLTKNFEIKKTRKGKKLITLILIVDNYNY